MSPPKKAIDPILFARPSRPPTAGNRLSSKVIKMRYDEDEFFY